jgi:hypothetical protein
MNFIQGQRLLALDVPGPGVAGFGGVFLGDLVAVSEHFGDQGSGNLGDKFP